GSRLGNERAWSTVRLHDRFSSHNTVNGTSTWSWTRSRTPSSIPWGGARPSGNRCSTCSISTLLSDNVVLTDIDHVVAIAYRHGGSRHGTVRAQRAPRRETLLNAHILG